MPTRLALLAASLLAGLTATFELGAVASCLGSDEPTPPPVATTKNGDVGAVAVTKNTVPLPQQSASVTERRTIPAGVSIKIASLRSAEERKLLTPIIAQLKTFESQPPERSRHFQWMDQYHAQLVRWRGEIQAWQDTADGLRVTVKVWPDVLVPGMRTTHMDYFLEDYIYTRGRLIYVGHQDPGPHQGFVRF